MERESAVREILQSIGPLFPEDAQRARAARRQAVQQDAGMPQVADEAAADPLSHLKLSTAPKPVLASQVDDPAIQKTHVANLAAVLDRLTPQPAGPSVRDTIPELVHAAPDVNALRAALVLRAAPERAAEPVAEPAAEPARVPEPALAAAPAFTELPSDPVVTPAGDDAQIEPGEALVAEPSPEEIQAALAEAVEAQRTPEEKAASAEPKPEPVPATPEFSEDEHDAFVSAIADAILPARPYPPVAGAGHAVTVAPAVRPKPAIEAVDATAGQLAVAPVPSDAAPKPKFKRAKRKQTDKKPEMVRAPVVKAPEPEVPEPAIPEPAAAKPAAPEPDTRLAPAVSTEDDELIRQIRVHRDDMVDVDDQIARIDQEIAAQQQAMAHFVAVVESKNAHRARLVRLRSSTQRFVDTLQVKAEPVKRQPKAKKSA